MTPFLLGVALVTDLQTSDVMEFTIRPDRPRQVIENFGASDSWTVEPLIKWPVKTRQKVADLLFDRKKGAGLTSWRFNFGGGINHETISNPLRTVDTFQVSEGVYDWNRVPGQRWMLEAARRAGVETFIGYAVTPTKIQTRNGFTNGTDGQGTTNLLPEKQSAYARYLVDVIEHLQKSGYNFTHLSPVNEPDFEWNKGSQEGNRASNKDIQEIGSVIKREIDRRKVDVRLLLPEANSPQAVYEPNANMAKKYGAEYANYGDWLAKNPDWIKETDLVFGYHSYWSDRLEQIIPTRQKLKAAMDKSPGVPIWQTEFCQMAGPRGEGGWGRDLGMTLALNTARIIHFDMTIVETTAWQWWLAVSSGDYKDGLVYVDDLDKPDGSVFASKTLFAIGNYARFIRPGYRRIEVEGNTKNPWGTLVSAYMKGDGSEVVVVAVNTETESSRIKLNMPGKWSATPHITSDRPGDDVRALPKFDSAKETTVPSRSVVTYVLKKTS